MNSAVSIMVDYETDRILLLKRANDIVHAGEICLPGGFRDSAVDHNDFCTAIRETFEETGIDLNYSAPICQDKFSLFYRNKLKPLIYHHYYFHKYIDRYFSH